MVWQTQQEQPQAQALHSPQPLEIGTIPLPIIYFVSLHGDYIQMSFFHESSKTRTIIVPKLQILVSFSNQVFFVKCEHNILQPLKIYFQWCITQSNRTSFDPFFKGFVVGNQIPNLPLAPSFDQNLCQSGLNEQCKGTLSI